MRDPFSWSLPLGRMFGVTVKVHLLFIVFVVAMWLRGAVAKDWPPGAANAILVLLGLTFLSVLLHEFGHCFAARMVEGDADEVLLWPLGGLARCEVPHTPRANLLAAAGGPAVNLALCLVTAGVLAAFSYVPPLNPLPENALYVHMFNWGSDRPGWHVGYLWYAWSTAPSPAAADGTLVHPFQLAYWQFLLGQFFWVNWFLFLLNVLLVGFPLDGGRMLQAVLWTRLGYRQSMLTAVFIGFLVMFVVIIAGLVMNEVLWLFLAFFIYQSCKNEWILLETGNEDSIFGYDFSQGYTSLEQEEEQKPRRKRQNFLQRWLQRRAQKKMQREMERTAAEERRMDELLEKIQRHGQDSLTDEEQRFLKRVSDRYKNKK